MNEFAMAETNLLDVKMPTVNKPYLIYISLQLDGCEKLMKHDLYACLTWCGVIDTTLCAKKIYNYII
jgi:hypothetical protein